VFASGASLPTKQRWWSPMSTHAPSLFMYGSHCCTATRSVLNLKTEITVNNVNRAIITYGRNPFAWTLNNQGTQLLTGQGHVQCNTSLRLNDEVASLTSRTVQKSILHTLLARCSILSFESIVKRNKSLTDGEFSYKS
jgi:hypothetical protein